ncbi:helix-turn-helix domain-containing protein [Winogradskyella undariae]|uniref:helix-turn-helix domain-containing protein n=1 Tax=Winogradskyella undariae TaxID=1285465 RepID=UPI00156B6CDB|nr:helix-turn-helix domain-containing protein [Winogradskyella undariae]NRR91414.1 helix-turn-helix domain-containing protein [Winogradskyella undariae]
MEFIQNEIKEIKDLLLALNIQQKEILTVEDATVYLQLSKSCLFKMTSKKEIPFYKPGGKKIYFKKSELDEWIFNGKVLSNDELDTDVEDYLSRTSKNLAS